MAVRRLGFYARCGAKDTGWTEHLFDAWFRVLVLPCCGGKVRSPEEAVRQLADCYRRTMGEPQWRRNVTFYRPDGVEVELLTTVLCPSVQTFPICQGLPL